MIIGKYINTMDNSELDLNDELNIRDMEKQINYEKTQRPINAYVNINYICHLHYSYLISETLYLISHGQKADGEVMDKNNFI